MSRFFIDRPIVAIVISVLMTIVGTVALIQLPIAQYPNANINLVDQLTRVPGISTVNVFGAGQYAMRLWVKPDQLAKLNVTVSDIITAMRAQNTVNPAGQIGGDPAPPGQEFTYTARAPGRLTSIEEFEQMVVRANPDGSLLRMKDVARIELGAQTYTWSGRLDGKQSTVLSCYQLGEESAGRRSPERHHHDVVRVYSRLRAALDRVRDPALSPDESWARR